MFFGMTSLITLSLAVIREVTVHHEELGNVHFNFKFIEFTEPLVFNVLFCLSKAHLICFLVSSSEKLG